LSLKSGFRGLRQRKPLFKCICPQLALFITLAEIEKDAKKEVSRLAHFSIHCKLLLAQFVATIRRQRACRAALGLFVATLCFFFFFGFVFFLSPASVHG
jgi:hypothetical protein